MYSLINPAELIKLCHPDNQGVLAGKYSRGYMLGKEGWPKPSTQENILETIGFLDAVLDEHGDIHAMSKRRVLLLDEPIYAAYRAAIKRNYFGRVDYDMLGMMNTVLGNDFEFIQTKVFDGKVGCECYSTVLYFPDDIRPETIAVLYHRIT